MVFSEVTHLFPNDHLRWIAHTDRRDCTLALGFVLFFWSYLPQYVFLEKQYPAKGRLWTDLVILTHSQLLDDLECLICPNL